MQKIGKKHHRPTTAATKIVEDRSNLSHRHYNFADLFVRFHEPVRLNDLIKTEGARNERLEFSVRELRVNRTYCAFAALRVCHDREQRVAPNDQAFSDRRKEREWRRFRRKRTVDKNHPFRAHRLRDLLQFRSRHRIKCQVHARTPCDLPNFLGPTLGLGVNDMLGTGTSNDCAFASLRVVAIGIAPTEFANSIAASPTLLAAAVINTYCPCCIFPNSISPYAVRYCIQMDAPSMGLRFSGYFAKADAGKRATSPYV